MQSKIYFGVPSGSPSGPSIVFDLVTLSSGDISSQTITLAQTPTSLLNMMAWVINGSTFTPSVDFTLTGNVVDFSGSSYVGTLAEGNQIQFIYEVTP